MIGAADGTGTGALVSTIRPVCGGPAEVVQLCRELVRFDTSNPGRTERPAAEYVAGRLAEVGINSELVESEPGRCSVVARVAGRDPARPALLVHGHLDVVPAEAADWASPPFEGELRGGCLWGRGTVDMKDMDAMVLAVVRQRAAERRPPARDLVLAFVADEEAGGRLGARWLVDNRPELFEGCTEAIGEVGGFSATVAGQRVYPVEVAEKGMAWLRLTATGRPGHGSMLNDANAVHRLAAAVDRLARYRFPIRVVPSVAQLLTRAAALAGVPFDPEHPEDALAGLGDFARVVGATLRHTVTPTMLQAGYKVNVVPGTAEASVDGRFLPGGEEDFLAAVDELIGPQVRRSFIHRDVAYETTFDGPLVEAMTGALLAEDPAGQVVPYCLSGGTDAKSFSRLGMRCFGFSPLRLPEGLDFFSMFHGVDERVPVDALTFGVRVLDRLLDLC